MTDINLIQAYGDETGVHKGAPITAVAVYLATVEQWARFSDAWRAVLTEFNITVFHATDYEGSYGEFKGWSKQRRVEFGRKLYPVLAEHPWLGIGYAVVNSDYEEALKGHDRLKNILSSPYMICLQGVIERLLRPFHDNPTPDRLAFYFETNDHAGEALRYWQWLWPAPQFPAIHK